MEYVGRPKVGWIALIIGSTYLLTKRYWTRIHNHVMIKLLHNFLLKHTEMVSKLHIFDIRNAFTIPLRVKILH